MTNHYPSHSALRLADQIVDRIGERVPGYQGRIGVHWYWRLRGGILVTLSLDFSVTHQRWDTFKAQAVTANVGYFNGAEFPFAQYGTLNDSPPFIHDLEGIGEWSNRLYFQIGHMMDDIVLWLETLLAAVLDPQIRPPTAFPALTTLECDMVKYAIESLNGQFTISTLHRTFGDRISKRNISRIAQRWEDIGLLTENPRRVTIALQALVKHSSNEK
ncbi:MAG: hypothetical protein P1S60_04455 [Anaerolineae bacterium]|nr:hypothetical protein [Anaerolineae bacterium]